MGSKLIELLRGLTKEDFREIMAFMTITSSFIFMFAVVFIQIWYPMPESAVKFADIILGFLFGSVVRTIMDYFFGKKLGE